MCSGFKCLLNKCWMQLKYIKRASTIGLFSIHFCWTMDGIVKAKKNLSFIKTSGSLFSICHCTNVHVTSIVWAVQCKKHVQQCTVLARKIFTIFDISNMIREELHEIPQERFTVGNGFETNTRTQICFLTQTYIFISDIFRFYERIMTGDNLLQSKKKLYDFELTHFTNDLSIHNTYTPSNKFSDMCSINWE